MRAVQCPELGAPDVLAVVEIQDPLPAADEVVIDVRAAGVNFSDGLIVAGKYQTHYEPPFIPGSEVAGVVSAVGSGVVGLAEGDRVTAYCGMGGYAQKVSVGEAMVHRVPGDVPFVTACSLPVAYGTVMHALADRADLRSGETLLVLGASGGIGLAAVEIGKAIGAQVIAAASTREKLAIATEHGADVALLYHDTTFAEELRAAANGVDVVCDPVGGPHAMVAVKSLRWGGRFLTIGYASGDIPRVGLNRLLVKEAAALGVAWGAWARRSPSANAHNMAKLLELARHGHIRPRVGDLRPIEEAAAVLGRVLDREVSGKSVLEVGGQA